MIRVLLADDEAMIRAGVSAILASDPSIEVVAEASNGREAVDLARLHRPDVVLLDIRMPVMDGLQAVSEIRRVTPSVAVIVLTTFGEDEHIARAIDGGASGFLLKTGDPRDLIAGVRAVADGGAYLAPLVARRIITLFATGTSGGDIARGADARRQVSVLTDRERDVLRLVGSGLSNAEIGAELYIVEGTVKAHVSKILSRLGLGNRVQAALLAHAAGLS
ncbi:response regulator transcription factor [Oerskovia sp. KBS0722]|uniref:response regulator transcription factor n=1 Tax=Oerskovia sp. KBS0722 TaxID=1179673 RepID=UPI00110F1662|nr:response regulator transcription factor [Oerskovia sp. KBS0722]QDW61968.1 response regulator transcription factor [Oerskovia sp. KBS0722]